MLLVLIVVLHEHFVGQRALHVIVLCYKGNERDQNLLICYWSGMITDFDQEEYLYNKRFASNLEPASGYFLAHEIIMS